LDAIPAGLYIHGPDGAVLSANKALGLIYDKSPDQFLGRTCADLFHQGPQQCPHELILQSMGQAEVSASLGAKTYQVILNAIIDPAGTHCGFTRLMIEIADQSVNKPLKSERTGTLEQMISGIAHDLGTPLGIISGYSEYLLMRSRAGEPGYKELSTILQQTRRIADSIKQMLDLVRPSSGRADAIGLKGFLAELIELMGHHLRKAGVTASVSCCPNPPLIHGDGPKLRRALFNLVINAIETIGPGGEIELILSEVQDRTDLVRIILAGRSESGPPPDFGTAFAGILSDGAKLANGTKIPDGAKSLSGAFGNDPGLSLTREILEGFKAEIEAIDLGERRIGLGINLPVRSSARAGAPLPQ
jgi:nitrogen-specific signal transduction histidine kinase